MCIYRSLCWYVPCHATPGCWPSRWGSITRGSASSCPVLRCVHVATILHCRGPKKISSVSNSWIYLSEYLAMSLCNKGFHLKLPHHFFWITRILLTNCLQGGVFFGVLAIAKVEQVMKSNCPRIVVGIPSRILALIRSRKLPLKNVKYIVDECNKMLEQLGMYYLHIVMVSTRIKFPCWF